MSGYYQQPRTPTQPSGFSPQMQHNGYMQQQPPPPTRTFSNNQPSPNEFHHHQAAYNAYTHQAYSSQPPPPPSIPRSPSVPAYSRTPQQQAPLVLHQRQQSFSPMPAGPPITQSQVMQRAKTLDQLAQLQKYQAEHTPSRHGHSPSLPAPTPPMSPTSSRALPSPHFHRQPSATKDDPLPALPQRSGTMPPPLTRPPIQHTPSSSSPKKPLPSPSPSTPPVTSSSRPDFSRFDPQAQLSRLNSRSVSPPKSSQMYNAPDTTPTRRRASPPRFQEPPSIHFHYQAQSQPIVPPPRSNSPAKIVSELPALAESGKTFVPLWKRNLASRSNSPAPEMKRADTMSNGNGGRPLPSRPPISPTKSAAAATPSSPTKSGFPTSPTKSGFSTSPTKSGFPPSPTKSGFPTSPTKSGFPANSQISVSDSEDDESEADTQSIVSVASTRPPPSPQYGIRDLPSRREVEISSPKHGIRDLPSRKPDESPKHGIRELPSSPGKTPTRPFPKPPTLISQSQSLPGIPNSSTQRGATQPPPSQGFPRPQQNDQRSSKIMQLAQMSLDDDISKSRQQPAAGSGFTRSTPQWPTNVPPLPRVPQQPQPPQQYQQQSRQSPTRSRRDFVNLEDSPPLSIHRRSPSPTPPSPRMNKYSSPERTPISHPRPMSPAKAEAPVVKIESPSPLGGRDKRPDIPTISLPDDEDSGIPQIQIQSADPPQITVFEVPGISVDTGFGGAEDNGGPPQISVSSDDGPSAPRGRIPRKIYRGHGLICGGCGGPIVGRIVAAMGIKWHPQCFKCSVCDENLEHVSSYEHEGLPYCHLDYHENFAPKCYHCKTPIIEERFISLDDTALGKRAYHEPHFFCSECGDPFMDPSASSDNSRKGELTISGDGVFTSEDDVGFVVYKGYPYCEACHVRLRLPKCKRCGKSIRDHMEAVEALGGKWCWECFVCAGCDRPFENPSFFEREGHPFCERCYSIILRNDV